MDFVPEMHTQKCTAADEVVMACGSRGMTPGKGKKQDFTTVAHHVYSDYHYYAVLFFVFRTTKTHVIVHLYTKFPL
jgi:hypothetical protein